MKHTLCLLLLLAGFCLAEAKTNRLFTTDHNLPSSLVNRVAEDAYDMIWVATEDGLCRYNGSQIVNYRNDPDNPHSVQSNFVRTVCCDSLGHVLVATLNGVQLFRPETNDFSEVICAPDLHILPGNIQSITRLANGDFLACGNVIFTIHIDEKGEPHALANAFTHNLGMAYDACQDPQGNIWVIRSSNGIFCLDAKGGLRELLDPHGKPYLFNSLGQGSHGEIYTGGLERGLYRYDKASDAFVEVTSPQDKFMVKDLTPIAGSEQLYVATDGDGIKVFDPASGQFSPYLFDDAQIDAETQKVHSLLLSRNGDLWMALYQRGVFVETNDPIDFHYYGSRSLRYNCVGDRCVTALLRTQDGNLWVGTDNGGLYGVDGMGHLFAHIPCGLRQGAVPSSIVRLFQDSRGRCWYGSYRQGGGIVDLKSGLCRTVPIEGSGEVATNIYDFAEDRHGRIWVGSMGQGILLYDEQKQLFVRQQTTTACDWTGALCYDAASDRLFCGTYAGLIILSLSQPGLPSEQIVPNTVIYSISQPSATQMALSTNSGLILYDLTSGETRTYTMADGLPNNNIYAALADSEGNLWVTGNNGLSKINVRQQNVVTFTSQDGLQCSEFYKNAAMRDADGTLWFGGTTGISWFNPREIRQEQTACEVRIVSFEASENEILPDGRGCFAMGDEAHAFSVEFATTPLLKTHSVIYYAALDDDVMQALPPMSNRVSFSGISSGRHVLRYQIENDGVRSQVHEAVISIPYPWYRSFWANLLWLLLGLLSVYGVLSFVRRRRAVIKLRRLHENEKAINEAKLQSFMNIAHEFRTPMTLVVAPLQKLINTDKDPKRQHTYQLIDRNANRVLQLINELMDLRKIDKAQMKLLCRQQPVAQLIDNLCESVSDLSADHDIDLHHDNHLPEGFTSWIDRDNFEKVVLNLLSNAIKYTPKGGSIVVDTSLDKEQQLCIAVTDTGIGIPPQDREHIFERFYQVRHTKSHMSTGIGLNLVQALVSLHHGTITVSGNPSGQGTRFVVVLPTREECYLELERTDADVQEPQLEQTVSQSDIVHSVLREDVPLEQGIGARLNRSVLVVDDDDEVRRYLVQELSPLFHVEACENGSEALELLQRSSFDLVLSDVMMPVMDGIQLCVRIRSNVLLNHLPVVLLTAKSSDEDRLHSLDIGANAFIAKPFNMELVTKTVQNLIAEHDRLRSSFNGQQLPVDQVDTPELESPDERLLKRIVKIVNENLSNPELTSEMIAQEVGLSRVHLYRKLKELTQQSARNYIRNIRLVKAAEMLSKKKMAISEVAYEVGFSNPNNFATAFKEMYGVSPTAYNERHCNENKADVTK